MATRGGDGGRGSPTHSSLTPSHASQSVPGADATADRSPESVFSAAQARVEALGKRPGPAGFPTLVSSDVFLGAPEFYFFVCSFIC